MSKCLLEVSKHFIRWEHEARSCAPAQQQARDPSARQGLGQYQRSRAQPDPGVSGRLSPCGQAALPASTSGEGLAGKREARTGAAFWGDIRDDGGKAVTWLGWILCRFGADLAHLATWCCPFVLSKVGVQKAPSLVSTGRFVLSLASCLVQRENRHVLEGRDIIFHRYERCWKTHTKPEKLSNRQLWYMQSRRVGGGYLFSCPSCAPLL